MPTAPGGTRLPTAKNRPPHETAVDWAGQGGRKRRKNRYAPRDNADHLLLSGDGRSGRDSSDELELLARSRGGEAASDDSQTGWDAALLDVLEFG